MAVFLVGYDMRAGQDYTRLHTALKTFPNWWHYLDSTWIIESNNTAIEVRDYLLHYIYKNDKMLVLALPKGSGAAWYGFSQNGSDWLMSVL